MFAKPRRQTNLDGHTVATIPLASGNHGTGTTLNVTAYYYWNGDDQTFTWDCDYCHSTGIDTPAEPIPAEVQMVTINEATHHANTCGA